MAKSSKRIRVLAPYGKHQWCCPSKEIVKPIVNELAEPLIEMHNGLPMLVLDMLESDFNYFDADTHSGGILVKSKNQKAPMDAPEIKEDEPLEAPVEPTVRKGRGKS